LIERAAVVSPSNSAQLSGGIVKLSLPQTVVLVILCVCATGAFSAGYPERPIRLIAPFAPGGNTDITARLVAQGLSARLGQPVVVENQGGAGGRIGTTTVAKAQPDGYTMLLGSNGPLTINAVFTTNVGYDPLKDFAYVSLVSEVPLVLSSHPSVPVRNVKELIALAKSRPGRLTMGSAGVGSNTHLTGEAFQLATGIKVVHVPFRGSAQALVDVLAGQVDFFFDQLSSSVPHIKVGKLKPLGIASLERASMFPDIPTLDESGVRGFQGSTYTTVAFPAAVSKDILKQTSNALLTWLDQRATKESFAKLGAEVTKSSSEDATRRIRNDIEQWKKVKQATNITIE
jgi:putative tricarboxylic transport membrane protein